MRSDNTLDKNEESGLTYTFNQASVNNCLDDFIIYICEDNKWCIEMGHNGGLWGILQESKL